MMMASGIELLLFLFFGLGGSLGAPLGLPPGPEDPMMAAIAPDECLVYSTWTGSVPPSPDGPVTERWLAQPEMVTSWEKLIKAYTDFCLANAGEEDRDTVLAAAALTQHLISTSVAFYITDIPVTEDRPWQFLGGVVVDFGDDADTLKDHTDRLIDRAGQNFGSAEPTTIEGRSFRTIAGPGNNQFTWGMIDDRHFALTCGADEMQQLLARSKTEPPQWLTGLRERMPVARVSSVSHLDGSRLMKLVVTALQFDGGGPEFNDVMQRLGLDQFRGFNSVTGLDDDGFIGRSEVLIEGEPTGLFAIFGDTPLGPAQLGQIADDRMLVSAAAISPSRVYQLIESLAGVNEFTAGEFEDFIDGFNKAAELDLKADIIRQLDEYAYVYGSINMANPTAGWVLAAGASNEMGLTDPYENVVKLLEKSLEDIDDFELDQSDVNGNNVYTLSDQRDWAFMPDVSWSLANSEIVLSMDKSSIRRHLRRESMASDALVNNAWFARVFQPPHDQAVGPLAVSSVDYTQLIRIGLPVISAFADQALPVELEFSMSDLPSVDVLTRDMRPSLTSVFRTPQGFEMVQRQTYPGGSPVNLIAATTIATLPAVIQVRHAAMRSDSANRIRQLVLAMHNYHDSHGAMPARFSKDAAGNKLLSWRVHILPYLEQNDLYLQFHLDEPWDSEHNKTLIDQMPAVFAHPSIDLEAGKTVYVVPDGPDAIMIDPEQTVDETDSPTGTRLDRVLDGTSQTALMLEVSGENAVTWTKPDDYPWEDQMRPEAGLAEAWQSGVNVGMCDGSVQLFRFEKLAEIFVPLVQASDGEALDLWGD